MWKRVHGPAFSGLGVSSFKGISLKKACYRRQNTSNRNWQELGFNWFDPINGMFDRDGETLDLPH